METHQTSNLRIVGSSPTWAVMVPSYSGLVPPTFYRKTRVRVPLGSKLLDDAVKKYKGVDLTVKKTNINAIRMYKKYGFAEEK